MKQWLVLMLMMLLLTASACTPAADVTENVPTATPQVQQTQNPESP